MNFGRWLNTYEKARAVIPSLSEENYLRIASNDGRCYCCKQRHVWRLAHTGMCFTCTTGESDASDDYEIGTKYK